MEKKDASTYAKYTIQYYWRKLQRSKTFKEEKFKNWNKNTAAKFISDTLVNMMKNQWDLQEPI